MKRSKRKLKIAVDNTAGAQAPSSDAEMISECVILASSVAAWHSAFSVDPDGDSKHAERIAGRYSSRAHVALEKITTMPATTAEGLVAKARTVPHIIKHAIGMDGREEAFFASFAADVDRFLDPTRTGRFRGEDTATAAPPRRDGAMEVQS